MHALTFSTVLDALNNLANQEIFDLAKAADKAGERTVGVITKSDAVGTGDEAPVCDPDARHSHADWQVLEIAQNQALQLRHGWFAVRNLSTHDKNRDLKVGERRDLEEAHFNRSPWSQLPRDRVGTPALKIRLAQILFEHIQKEFPLLLKEIRVKVIATRKQVDEYGESRTTTSEQRQFLTRIANLHQSMNTQTSRGIYQAGLKAKDPRKLRMHIRSENEKFNSKILSDGHTFNFKKAEEIEAGQDVNWTLDQDNDQEEEEEEFGTEPSEQEEYSDSEYEDSELDKVSNSQVDDEDEDLDIYDWIHDSYEMSRGTELPGTVNPAVLETLFRQQATQWKPIAQKYLTRIDKAVLRYLQKSSRDLITDDSTRRLVDERIDGAISKTRETADAQLDQLVKDEMDGFLITMNNYFTENLDKNRRARQLIKLKKQGESLKSHKADGGDEASYLNDLIREVHLSNDRSAVHDIHDTLEAYYKVAVKRFIDNVVIQVTERYYLGETGPLKFFSPAYIGGLKDEELSRLAGESEMTTKARNGLVTLLSKLEEALRLAENYQ